jgi:hypothetical protein
VPGCVHQTENTIHAIRATLRKKALFLITLLLRASFAMRHPWRQSSDGVDLDQAVRVVGRRRRYHLAICQRALVGENSPLVSSRISGCRHVGRLPTSA